MKIQNSVNVLILVFLCTGAWCQEKKKIMLTAPASTEISIMLRRAPAVTMSVSKKDFLASYKNFKNSYFNRIADSTVARYEKAMQTISGSRKFQIDAQEKAKNTYAELVHKWIGADLLNAGLAQVSVDGASQNYIESKSLIPSPEAAYWTYTDEKGQEFFYGAMYGSMSAPVMEEVTIYIEPTPPQPEDDDPNKVWTVVEEQPAPEGMSFSEYAQALQARIVMPKEAIENKISGTVFVEMIIEKDGSFGEVKVLRGKGFGLDEEAVRVLREGPRWKGGRQAGKAVRTRFIYPVKFILP